MRAVLKEAEMALGQAKACVAQLREMLDAEEDAADLAIGLQRLQEVREDPSLIITGEALTRRLAALR